VKIADGPFLDSGKEGVLPGNHDFNEAVFDIGVVQYDTVLIF
jgi:hypothetical protein